MKKFILILGGILLVGLSFLLLTWVSVYIFGDKDYASSRLYIDTHITSQLNYWNSEYFVSQFYRPSYAVSMQASDLEKLKNSIEKSYGNYIRHKVVKTNLKYGFSLKEGFHAISTHTILANYSKGSFIIEFALIKDDKHWKIYSMVINMRKPTKNNVK